MLVKKLTKAKNIYFFLKKNAKHLEVWVKSRTFASLLKGKPPTKDVWRDGRVVDYSSLENCRTERCRGFESLSLRKENADFL